MRGCWFDSLDCRESVLPGKLLEHFIVVVVPLQVRDRLLVYYRSEKRKKRMTKRRKEKKNKKIDKTDRQRG